MQNLLQSVNIIRDGLGRANARLTDDPAAFEQKLTRYYYVAPVPHRGVTHLGSAATGSSSSRVHGSGQRTLNC